MKTIHQNLTKVFEQLPQIATWAPEQYVVALSVIRGATEQEIALAIVGFIRSRLVASEAATKAQHAALSAAKEIQDRSGPLH
jgi:hypothetical protein